MKEVIIDGKNYGQRVDKYLLRFFPQMSKSFLYKMFRKKNIVLNKKKIAGNEILKVEDRIQIYFSEETFVKFQLSNRKTVPVTFQILYEDEDILAINKPANLLSQPNGKDSNLVDQISSYLPNNRIGLVSRLDRNTTGVILAGKNVQALQALNQTTIEKEYHTIICGSLEKEILLIDRLLKNDGQNKVQIKNTENIDWGSEIETKVIPIKSNNYFTLVKVMIKQGKTHQIRAHLASIHYPILGDFKYGNSSTNKQFKEQFGLQYQLLHSFEVKWENYKIQAPYPLLFEKIKEKIFG